MSKSNQQYQTGMVAFARLTKIDEAKRLVFGRATQEIPDRAGEIFDYASSKPNFEAWSKSQMDASLGKSAGNLRAMHKDVGAGILTPENGIVYHDDERAIDICAKVVDDAEWDKVKAGVYTGFSIGGRYMKKWEDPDLKKTRYTADPSEISLVDRPAVPTATFFEIQKADGSLEKKEFAKAQEETVQLVRADGAGLAVFVPPSVLPEPGKEFTFEKFDYQLVKVDTLEGKKVAVVEIIYSVSGKPEELGAFAKLLSDRSLSITEATAIIAKSAPAEKTAEPADADILALAAQKAWDEEKVALADFTKMDKAKQQPYIDKAKAELLAKVAAREDTSQKEGEHKYGNVTFADEKNKKYPLDTEAHVRAALSYWGMRKNRAKYSAEDQATIGAKIHAAAAKMGIGETESKKLEAAYQDQIDKAANAVALALAKADGTIRDGDALSDINKEPYVKKAEAALEVAILRKGLATCAQFAMVLNSLCQVCESIELEAAAEGDGSTIAADIYNHIADLGQCLQDCIAEEVKEEVEGNYGGAGQASAATMAAAAAVDGLMKRVDPIRKAYAAVNKRHIQKMHDTSVAMGALCKDAQNKGGVLDTAAGYRKVVDAVLAKALPGVKIDEAVLTAAISEAPATAEILKVDGAEPLAKALAENTELKKSLGSLEERMRKIEAQPATVRIVAKPHAVDKGADTGGGAPLDAGMKKAAEIAATIEPIRKADGSIDEIATATKITRAMGGHNVLQNTAAAKG